MFEYLVVNVKFLSEEKGNRGTGSIYFLDLKDPALEAVLWLKYSSLRTII